MFQMIFFLISFFPIFSVFATSEVGLRGTFLDGSNYEFERFKHFRSLFLKEYRTIEEEVDRFRIFRQNLRAIDAHNTDIGQNFTMGINQFTDLTPEEFKTLYASGYKGLQSFGCSSFTSHGTSVPDSIDWTAKGVVNPVRDQGQCGSCWAFATTANAESVWAISSGKLLDLSEEFLVDCASGVGYFNMGCNGGNPDSAFKYMINNGQRTEASYPYTAGVTKTAGTCQKGTSANVKFTGCYDVAPKDQLALKAAVAKQPVTIAIEADTRYFQSYSGGILTDATKCGVNLDHAVEIVGYGTENGIDYWKVRNSWSTSWGESGYFRLQRSSSTNDIGVCGVAAEPSFPSV